MPYFTFIPRHLELTFFDSNPIKISLPMGDAMDNLLTEMAQSMDAAPDLPPPKPHSTRFWEKMPPTPSSPGRNPGTFWPQSSWPPTSCANTPRARKKTSQPLNWGGGRKLARDPAQRHSGGGPALRNPDGFPGGPANLPPVKIGTFEHGNARKTVVSTGNSE